MQSGPLNLKKERGHKINIQFSPVPLIQVSPRTWHDQEFFNLLTRHASIHMKRKDGVTQAKVKPNQVKRTACLLRDYAILGFVGWLRWLHG